MKDYRKLNLKCKNLLLKGIWNVRSDDIKEIFSIVDVNNNMILDYIKMDDFFYCSDTLNDKVLNYLSREVSE